jgi:hypothetical protein
MAAVQATRMDIAFDQARWAALQADLEQRAIHECADLVPHLAQVSAPTYAAMWQAGLDLVAAKRGKDKPAWVGVKELWSIEFVTHFLREWPSSKTVLIVRDPRAVVASMLKMGENDASQQAQILSYLRHWRKTAAFALTLRASPQADGRFMIVRYEDLVARPDERARELCRFFDVPFHPGMIDASGFWDPSRRSNWQGNSSYATAVSSIDPGLAERWKTYLPEASATLIDYICGPDMRLFGYQPRGGRLPAIEQLPTRAYLSTYGEPSSWRSDSGDPLLDLGLEVARRALLACAERPDARLIERCFLFEQVFDDLKKVQAA